MGIVLLAFIGILLINVIVMSEAWELTGLPTTK